MEAKRIQLNRNKQHQQNGQYVTAGSSKTQAMKSASEISLTPSQAAEQAKQNGRKHPLDALSKPSKMLTVERRSGLQEVDEEYFKQNIFRKPLHPQHLPPSEGTVTNQAVPQIHVISQPIYHQHSSSNQISQHHPTNLTPSQIQIQTQAQNQAGIMTQQLMNAKNHSAVPMHQNFHQQQQQNETAPTHGISNSGLQPTPNLNNTIPNPEPEMCTTCPNCQTTIFLVRGADVTQDMTTQQTLNNTDHQTSTGTAPTTAAGAV